MSERIERGRLAPGVGLPGAVIDAELRLQSADAAFCRLLGLNAAEILGRGVEELGRGRWDGTGLRSALAPLAMGPPVPDTPPLDLRLEPMLLGVGIPALWLQAQREDAAVGRGIRLWIRSPVEPVGAAPDAVAAAAPASPAPAGAAAGTGPAPEMLGRESYLLQLLMQAVPDPIFIKDRQLRFVQANHALGRKLGLSDSRQALGKTDADFFTPELADAFRARDDRVLTQGEAIVNWEQREVWRDGRATWALVTELPLRGADGEIAGLLGIVRDISDRRQAQEALLASERMYRSLFERSLCGVFLSTPQGRLLDVNDAFTAMMGYDSRAELLAHPAADLYFGPADRALHVEQLRRQGSVTNFEVRFRRKDGGEIWVLENTGLIRDERGEELLQGTVIDITERRQLEARLRESMKMEAVGKLAGGVAHDFNNLLTVISGQCEMLAMQAEPAARQQERLEAISAAAQRAAGLTRQLLAFGRQLPVSLEPVDLNACVRSCWPLLRSVMGEGVEIQLDLSPGLDWVQGDRREIEQALVHLAGNARSAMPEGGSLRVSTFNRELASGQREGARALVPGRYAVVALADSGVGMAPEVQARIFEPFYTTQEVGRGSGLGLAGILGMAQLSGGDLRVRSAPGQGATFEIWLPARSAPEAVAAARPTVLCLQPDANLRAALRAALEQGGYTVLEAATPEQALEQARVNPLPIHLLFVEPGGASGEGWNLCRQMRGLRPEIRFLAITAFAERLAAAQTASELGAHLLLKPFTPDGVVDRVREILGAAPALHSARL